MEQSGKPWYVPESSTKKPKVDSNLEITIVRLDDITSVPIKSKLNYEHGSKPSGTTMAANEFLGICKR